MSLEEESVKWSLNVGLEKSSPLILVRSILSKIKCFLQFRSVVFGVGVTFSSFDPTRVQNDLINIKLGGLASILGILLSREKIILRIYPQTWRLRSGTTFWNIPCPKYGMEFAS